MTAAKNVNSTERTLCTLAILSTFYLAVYVLLVQKLALATVVFLVVLCLGTSTSTFIDFPGTIFTKGIYSAEAKSIDVRGSCNLITVATPSLNSHVALNKIL